MAGLQPEFAKRNCKIIGLSVDPVAKLYDMLPAGAGDTSEGRTAAASATVRTVFGIEPDKKIELVLNCPMSTGRKFNGGWKAIKPYLRIVPQPK